MTFPGPTSVASAALLSLWLSACSADAGSLATGDALYNAQTIVTGRREETRLPGFARCLEDVFLRLTGDQRLLTKPGMETLRAEAGSMIADYGYHDRMEGIPVHDEQGTHDRPYDLLCSFDHAAVDKALASLGGRPWTGDRPRLAIVVAVDSGERFTLTEDGDAGRFMREALSEEAKRLALPIVLPATTLAREISITSETLPSVGPAALEDLAARSSADDILAGSLVWSDPELGWIATWKLEEGGNVHEWKTRGVNFDAAFRNALRGAAQILSGNGEP